MHYRIGVCTWPTNIERSKAFKQHFLLFVWLVCTHCSLAYTFFLLLRKSNTDRREHRSSAPQLLQLVSIIQELSIIEEKWRFVESIRYFKRTNKKVGGIYASYKKSEGEHGYLMLVSRWFTDTWKIWILRVSGEPRKVSISVLINANLGLSIRLKTGNHIFSSSVFLKFSWNACLKGPILKEKPQA